MSVAGRCGVYLTLIATFKCSFLLPKTYIRSGTHVLSDTEVLVRGDATVSFCLNLKDGADYITVNHARGLVFDAGAC